MRQIKVKDGAVDKVRHPIGMPVQNQSQIRSTGASRPFLGYERAMQPFRLRALSFVLALRRVGLDRHGYHLVARRNSMGTTSFTRIIQAPVERVFDVVAHIDNFAEAVPDITGVEYLTDQRSGVGTRFREIRDIRGKEATTDVEVTEYEKDKRVRMLSDAAGTIWDTLFTVTAEGESTRLHMVMEANPYKLPAKLTVRLLSGLLKKTLEADMQWVKQYCEESKV